MEREKKISIEIDEIVMRRCLSYKAEFIGRLRMRWNSVDKISKKKDQSVDWRRIAIQSILFISFYFFFCLFFFRCCLSFLPFIDAVTVTPLQERDYIFAIFRLLIHNFVHWYKSGGHECAAFAAVVTFGAFLFDDFHSFLSFQQQIRVTVFAVFVVLFLFAPFSFHSSVNGKNSN